MGNEATRFKPGAGGRPVGVKNKLTKTVKDSVLAVFNKLQLDNKHNLEAFAKKYPRDFYAISAKLIPLEVQATVEASVTWQETKTYEAKPKTDSGN